MSKTIQAIVGVVGVAALAVVTAGAAIGVAGGFTLGASISGTVAAVGSALGVSGGLIAGAAIGGLSYLASQFGPSAPKPQQTEVSLKSPRPPRVSGYGEGRQHGAFMLFITAANGTAIDVVVIHDGRINAILRYYLGDQQVTVLPDGRVQGTSDEQFGRDSDIVKVFTTMGDAVNTAFSSVIALVPDQWTTVHRGDGIVTGAVLSASVKADIYQKIYPTGGPNQMPLSLAMQRQLVFDWRDPTQTVYDPRTWKYSENAVLARVHYELVRKTRPPKTAPGAAGYWTEVANIYGERWNKRFAPTLDYLTAAANDCDVPVPLKGVQTILAEKADAGSGHVTVTSANGLTTGMTITIAATGDTSITETRSVTGISGLVVALDSSLTHDHPMGSQVTWASDAGSPANEPRYRTCVAHNHTDPHKGVIANLLACFDGWEAPRADGALIVRSGRYYTPTVEIGPDLILSYSDQDGIAEEDAVNQITVTYVSANHDYNVVDTDAWEDVDDIEARGKVLSDSIDNQVPSFSQARRLAKRKMAQILAGRRGTVEATAGARVMLGERYIMLRLADAGAEEFYAPVEVQQPVKRDPITGKITFNWILADPNIDAWNPATEEGEPAPVGNRIATAPLEPPVITSATPNYGADAATGAAGVFIDLIIGSQDRADLIWFARTRIAGSGGVWGERQYSDVDAGTSVEIQTEFVPADAAVEVEVAYQVGDGRISDWSASATVSTTNANTAPARVTGLSASGGAGVATVVWNNPTSANLAAERLYAGTGAVFSAANKIGDYTDRAGTASSHDATLTPGVWYFWVTTVSTNGVESAPVGPVTATVA